MNPASDHLAEDVLSTLLDGQLEPAEKAAAQAHLATCASCAQRFAELRSVVDALRRLPSADVPRNFTLEPRLVSDPPNLVRLQRWYAATRVAAAALAAVFVFLVGGTLYLDTFARPAAVARSLAVAPAATTPPAPANVAAAAPRALVQNAPSQAALSARPAGAAQAGDSTDQVAAATSIRPLPTLPPTPAPPVLTPAAVQAVEESVDPAAPWRAAASGSGVLAVFILCAAVVLRHRVRAARGAVILPTE